MLYRSFGAHSFYVFWRYWNPVWGYYLSRNIMKPAAEILPLWLAILVTFIVSGALHDIAVTVVKWRLTFFFTPWFLLMGVMVVASQQLNISYPDYRWGIRALINLLIIAGSLMLAVALETLYM